MGPKFHEGDKVAADFGDGYVVAFVAVGENPVDDDGEKWRIQKPDGSVANLAFNDEGAEVTGRTFRRLAA